MTSFAHQKNLRKWGWGGSEIRLAIINCKRRTDFAPTERPRCCGWIFSNYFFGTFRRPNCMARVTQNLKADTNTSLSLANWALSLYFDKPMDHFTHPWWEFFTWAKLVMRVRKKKRMLTFEKNNGTRLVRTVTTVFSWKTVQSTIWRKIKYDSLSSTIN